MTNVKPRPFWEGNKVKVHARGMTDTLCGATIQRNWVETDEEVTCGTCIRCKKELGVLQTMRVLNAEREMHE